MRKSDTKQHAQHMISKQQKGRPRSSMDESSEDQMDQDSNQKNVVEKDHTTVKNTESPRSSSSLQVRIYNCA